MSMSQATRVSDSAQDFSDAAWYTSAVNLWQIGLTTMLLALAAVAAFIVHDARRPPK